MILLAVKPAVQIQPKLIYIKNCKQQMKHILITAAAFTALAIAGCGGSSEKKETGKATTKMQQDMKKPAATPRIAIKKEDLADQLDPVCGMPAFKFLKDTAMIGDKIYGFCGEGCKDEFKKNTKQYVKK